MRNNTVKDRCIRKLFYACMFCILFCTVFLSGKITSAEAETEYEIYIEDQSGILDEAQKESLKQFMKPITRFCHVALLTTDRTDLTTTEYSQEFEDTHWIGERQISVLIDMGYREVTFNGDPVIAETIDKDAMNLILDETLPHVSEGEFYLFSRDNFIYINALLEGKTIQEGTERVKALDLSLRQNRYERTETGNEIIIEDYADLLTADEKDRLMDIMRPITEYGHVAMVSVSDTEKTTEEYAGDYVYDHWHNGAAALLLIDMKNRYIRIESDGAIATVVDENYGDTITDNIYHFAYDEDYFGCAEEAFSEIKSLLEGQRIAQPMKYISNALLAIIASVVTMFFVVSILVRRKAPALEEMTQYVEKSVKITDMSRKRRIIPAYSNSNHSSGGYFGGSGGHFGESGRHSSGSSSGYAGSSSSHSSGGSSSGSSSRSSGSHTSRGGEHRF